MLNIKQEYIHKGTFKSYFTIEIQHTHIPYAIRSPLKDDDVTETSIIEMNGNI